MSFSVATCTNCKSTDVEETSQDKYICMACRTKFNFTRPNDGTITHDVATHNCPVCGKSVQAGKGNKCTRCSRTDICENCSYQGTQKIICYECLEKSGVKLDSFEPKNFVKTLREHLGLKRTERSFSPDKKIVFYDYNLVYINSYRKEKFYWTILGWMMISQIMTEKKSFGRTNTSSRDDIVYFKSQYDSIENRIKSIEHHSEPFQGQPNSWEGNLNPID